MHAGMVFLVNVCLMCASIARGDVEAILELFQVKDMFWLTLNSLDLKLLLLKWLLKILFTTCTAYQQQKMLTTCQCFVSFF